VPPYPYGPSPIYKQSNFGLYGRQKIQFGNSVSEEHGVKNRRYWRPNVQRKRLWSESLQRFVRVRITTRVLRTVDKCGGLDEYLLGEKPQRIKELGMGGWKLRWRIMQTESIKERFRRQREALGLDPREPDGNRSDTRLGSEAEIAEEVRKFDEELAKEADVDIGEDAEEGMTKEDFMREEPLKKEKVWL